MLSLAVIYKKFIQILGKQSVFLNEPMRKHTSFRIGGPADILLLPSHKQQIIDIINICNQYQIPYYIMGNGTNLLVTDKGIRGVVIKVAHNMREVRINGSVIYAQAGILLSTLSKIALNNSLKGMEFACGIPGTLGGAVAMNAGAYGGQMKDIVTKVDLLDRQGRCIQLDNHDMKFGYRSSIVQENNYIVLGAQLTLQYGDYNTCKQTMDELNKRRITKQPLNMPSAGSVFKRPEGYYAGKLIQDSGLKGFKVGGAMVSDVHCGFIVNSGNATADDVISLIRHIQSQVKSRFGVELETEIKIVGEK